MRSIIRVLLPLLLVAMQISASACELVCSFGARSGCHAGVNGSVASHSPEDAMPADMDMGPAHMDGAVNTNPAPAIATAAACIPVPSCKDDSCSRILASTHAPKTYSLKAGAALASKFPAASDAILALIKLDDTSPEAPPFLHLTTALRI
jgi:hypothetical protein